MCLLIGRGLIAIDAASALAINLAVRQPTDLSAFCKGKGQWPRPMTLCRRWYLMRYCALRRPGNSRKILSCLNLLNYYRRKLAKGLKSGCHYGCRRCVVFKLVGCSTLIWILSQLWRFATVDFVLWQITRPMYLVGFTCYFISSESRILRCLVGVLITCQFFVNFKYVLAIFHNDFK